MKNSLIIIDLAKNVFQICGMDSDQRTTLNKKVTRKKLLATLSQFEATTVVMEACYILQPWGRAIQALGHTVKLIPPYQVKFFVAFANKMTRVAWAVMATGKAYHAV